MIAASCALNFDYWSAQGQTGLESHILGVVSVAVDLLKAALPVFIVVALWARRIIYASVACCAFLLFLMASLAASIGFLNKTHGAKVGTQEMLSASYLLVRQELTELDAELARLPSAPPVAAIKARIKAKQQNWRWTSTKDCTDATTSASRAFCAQYFVQREQLGAAVAAARLTARRTKLRVEVARLRQMGATQAADPQALLLARFVPGLDRSDAQFGLLLFIAAFIEVGAALGLYLATGHGWVATKSSWTNLVGTQDTREVQSQLPVPAISRREGPRVTIDLQPETRPFALKPRRPPKREGA